MFSDGRRAKLARVLGMMGSSHDAEALSAARAAQKIVTDAGMSWADLLDDGSHCSRPFLLQEPRRERTAIIRKAEGILLRFRARLTDSQTKVIADALFRGGESKARMGALIAIETELEASARVAREVAA